MLTNIVFSAIVIALSVVLAYYVHIERSQSESSIYWTIYAFGCLFLPGTFTVYPGVDERIDSTGFKTLVPRGSRLSTLQSSIIFLWIVGLGLALVYVAQL